MADIKRMAPLALLGAGAAVAVVRRTRNRLNYGGASVVITGGSRGLGFVLARQLADKGARLTLLARDEAELGRAADDLQTRGAEVLTVPCDVRDQEQVNAAIAQAIERYGRIDVLINNAGVIAVGPVEHMSVDDFKDLMDVHTWGSLYTMRAVAPHMRAQGGGRIVNIASIGGLIAVPHLAPYTVSKFALVGLSDAMRAELAKDNIRVTTVSPGLMRTGSHLNALFKGQRSEEFTWFSLGGAPPGVSMNAERAARQILAACAAGRPQLTLSLQANLLALSRALFPSTTARLSVVVARALPDAMGPEGDEAKPGWDSESKLSPSPLTHFADKATVEYNGLRGHEAPASS